MLFAEAVSIDGGTLLFILVALIALGLGALGIVISIFYLSWRAGRGSVGALVMGVVGLAFEVLLVVAISSDDHSNLLGLVLPAAQVVPFLIARSTGQSTPPAARPSDGAGDG